MISNEYLSGMPLLVLANKQDLPHCMGTMEIKPVFQQAGSKIGRRDCLIMPVSALTGEGVEEGLRWLVESVKRNAVIRPPRNNE
jgi:ADP-ribosylation factor related protein 1